MQKCGLTCSFFEMHKNPGRRQGDRAESVNNSQDDIIRDGGVGPKDLFKISTF